MDSSLSVSVKYGFFISLGLIGYFLILRLFGLHQNIWLRILNGAIMAYGLYAAIKSYKLASGLEFNYIEGFKTGLFTGFIGTFLFMIFMAIYLFHLDPEFMNSILQKFLNGNYGGGMLLFIILIEGFASTVVLTLSFMQIFKNSKKIGQFE